jgi:hypothetical protein
MPTMSELEIAIELRRLSPQTPIMRLTKGRGVPEETLNLVDALVAKACWQRLVAKDRLTSQWLPTIAPLQGCARIHPPCYHA